MTEKNVLRLQYQRPATRRLLTVVVAGIAAMTFPAHAVAQGAPAVLDTAIRPGHADYSRYDSPGACTQSTAVTASAFRRAHLDTAVYAPERDTLPSSATALAQRCGSRFTVTNTPAHEMFNLVRLSLMAGDDAKAMMAADRWLANRSDRSALGMAWSMLDLVSLYLGSRPARVEPAERLAARMDSLGRTVPLPRILAHFALFTSIQKRFDVARTERDGLAILALDALLTQDERQKFLAQTDDYLPGATEMGLAMLIYDLGVMAGYQYGNDAASHLLADIRQTGFTGGVPPDTVAMLVRQSTVFTLQYQLPSMTAAHWFGAPGTEVFPNPGKVSLYFNAADWGISSYAEHAMIRRLHEKYGDHLRMTIFTKTHGFFADSPPLNTTQEIDTLQKYFLHYLKLPVTVAIDTTPFTRLPDGRRIDGLASYEKTRGYENPIGGSGIWNFGLLDQRGQSLLMGFMNERAIEAFIDRALLHEGIPTPQNPASMTTRP